MKILITTDVYTSNVNGVVTSIKNLTKALTERGHEVRILTLSQRGASYREGNVYYIRSLDAGKVYPGARAAVSPCHRFVRSWWNGNQTWFIHSASLPAIFMPDVLPSRQRLRCSIPITRSMKIIPIIFHPVKSWEKSGCWFLTRHLLKKAERSDRTH